MADRISEGGVSKPGGGKAGGGHHRSPLKSQRQPNARGPAWVTLSPLRRWRHQAVSALHGRAHDAAAAASGGLAQWVERLPPGAACAWVVGGACLSEVVRVLAGVGPAAVLAAILGVWWGWLGGACAAAAATAANTAAAAAALRQALCLALNRWLAHSQLWNEGVVGRAWSLLDAGLGVPANLMLDLMRPPVNVIAALLHAGLAAARAGAWNEGPGGRAGGRWEAGQGGAARTGPRPEAQVGGPQAGTMGSSLGKGASHSYLGIFLLAPPATALWLC